MTDLDAVIRARLHQDRPYVTEGAGRYGRNAADTWHEALLAVLDLHKPVPVSHPLNPNLANCAVCMDIGPEICSPVGYPCDTVEAIAEKLGVEAS